MVAARAPGNPTLCISCVNRHYEVFKPRADGGRGANSKGGRPILCDVLHTVELLVTDAEGTRTVRAEYVTGAAEAIYAFARKAKGPAIFSRAVPAWFRERLASAEHDAPQPWHLPTALRWLLHTTALVAMAPRPKLMGAT